MPNKQYAYINNKILKWAREETPLSIDDVSIRLKDIDLEELKKYETGEELPSISIAKKMAKLYDIPFAALYLTDVPLKSKPDYIDRRTFSSSTIDGISYELWKEIRFFKSCRENLLSIIDEEYNYEKLPTLKTNSSIDYIVNEVRDFFKIVTPLKNKTAFGTNSFSYFRKIIEKKGILVFQISDIETKQIRGVSLNFDVFPIIAVNKKDTEKAKVFTMFHELVHLIRRTSGLCLIDFSERNDNEEKLCDEIAGNILVPKSELVKFEHTKIDEEFILHLSDIFGVSSFVILKRLYDEKMISNEYYKKKYIEFYNNFMENKKYIEKSNQEKNSNVPHHIRVLSTVGNLFPSLVLNAYYEGSISLGEACRTLNVKTKTMESLERMVVY